MLEVRGPVLGDRVLQPAAEVDRPVLLGHAPGMEVLARLLHRTAVVLHSSEAPLKPDQSLRFRLRRSPEVVVLVSADRPRKAVFRAEEVERARLPVVAR